MSSGPADIARAILVCVASLARARRLPAATDGIFSRPAALSIAKPTNTNQIGLRGCRFICAPFSLMKSLRRPSQNKLIGQPSQSAYLFDNLGHRVFFQFLRVAIEFTD